MRYRIFLALAILVAYPGFFIRPGGGGGAGSAPSITSLTVANSTTPSFTTGSSGTNVGSVAVAQSSGSFTGTIALSTSSPCSGTTGAQNGNFTLSSSTLPATLNTATTGGSGANAVCIVATESSASNSPFAGVLTVTGNAPGGTLALTRVFNNPGSTTGSTAFWMLGQPLKNTFSGASNDEVPSGNIVTCTLGGQSGDSDAQVTVPCTLAERKYANDGSVEWGQLLVDFSGRTITGGGHDTLVLTSAAGTFCDAQGTGTCTSGFTKTSWDGLGDVVTLTNFSNAASSTSKAVQGSGTWNAKFDGGVDDVETVIVDTPQGREVKVAGYLWDTTAVTVSSQSYTGTTLTLNISSTNINSNDGILLNISGSQSKVCSALNGNPIAISGGSEGAATAITCTFATNPGTVASFNVINRNMQIVMYYWATCKAVGTVCTTAGPVESWGPFIENIVIYPKTSGSYANSTLTAFTFDAAYDRNGSAVRDCASAKAYCAVTLTALAIANIIRADAQGDWTANDPGIYVTQAYGSVVNTRKIPPFTRGVTSYSPTMTSLNAPLTGTSGAILQFNAASFMGSGVVAQLLDFKSVGSLTGVSTGVVYGAAPTTGGACLYDTLAHAQASGNPSSCTGTGLITPGGTFTGAVLENAAGPMAVGQTEVAIETTGSGPMLALIGEWAAGYLVANTQGYQRIGRVQGYDWAAYVDFAIDAATGRIPCLIDAQGTSGSGDAGCPAASGALGTGYVADQWQKAYSSDINGGNAAAGGTAPWTTGVGDPEHVPQLVFGPWIMEGSPFLQDLLLLAADGDIANTGPGLRNNQVVTSGSIYHGNLTGELFQERAPAWTQRDVAYGAFAAPNGSLEESYFRTALKSTFAWNAAYRSAKGTNYTNMGYIGVDEQNFQNPQTVSNPVQNGSSENFMMSYLVDADGMGALLEGDYISGYATEMASHLKWLGAYYGNGMCPYYGSIYIHTPGLSGYNTALPDSWISQVAAGTAVGAGEGLTTGQGGYTTFPSSGTTLTLGASNQEPWTLVVGDKVRFLDFDISGGSYNNSQCPGTAGGHCPRPPSAFTIGQDYYIVSISGLNYSVSATSGGSPISSNGSATNVGTVFIPSAASCPSGTFAPTTQDPPDNFYFYQYAALALLAENGVSGALTDYNNAAALFTSGSNCAHLMNWCLTPP